jgi:hypothetical protein
VLGMSALTIEAQFWFGFCIGLLTAISCGVAFLLAYAKWGQR